MTTPVGALAGFWSRLSARERNLLAILLLVFLAMAIGTLFVLRSDSFVESEDRIAELRRGIRLMQTRGAVYKEKLKEKAARESMISSEPIEFAILLEEATKATLGEKTTTQEEEMPPLELGDGLVKRVYSFELRSVTLEEMTNFLHKVEAQPGHVVYTERMKVRSPSELEDRLNVEIELATWEMAKAETEDEKREADDS
ncbi:MAG TPA: hypothetical protein ENJ18_08810 [Nannocystis exedens]|nr:hypothetical protein [Nannocystis exedens]